MTMTTTGSETAAPRAARYIPWLFVAGMLLVVTVNGALVFFATTTWSGLATNRAYENGLAYNRTLATQARQDALGWSFDVRLQPAPGGSLGGATLMVAATDRNGWVIPGLQIDAVVERPLGEPDTRHLSLSRVADGIYAAALAPLAEGQWDARLTVTRGRDRMLAAHRLIAP